MSRIGRKPVSLPEGVSLERNGSVLTVNGPNGKLPVSIPLSIRVNIEDGKVSVERESNEKRFKALHGLVRMLIANSVEGVSKGFERVIEIYGTGYKAELSKNVIKMSLGYSHDKLSRPLPEGVSAKVENRGTKITLQGIDKQAVGEVAANIRKLRKPDSYKGKGVRFLGEELRLKPGKSGSSK